MSRSAFGIEHGDISKAGPGGFFSGFGRTAGKHRGTPGMGSGLPGMRKKPGGQTGQHRGTPGVGSGAPGARKAPGSVQQGGQKAKGFLQNSPWKAAGILGGGGALTGGIYANRKNKGV